MNTTQQTYGSKTITTEVQAKKSIRLLTVNKDGARQAVEFKVGDWAVYGSYNLVYTGQIVSIGEKTITIEAYPGTSNARRHRLALDAFGWRNHDFDAKAIADRNFETSHYI